MEKLNLKKFEKVQVAAPNKVKGGTGEMVLQATGHWEWSENNPGDLYWRCTD